MTSPILAVYFKELRDTLRDWRTLVVMVLLPLVLYPLLTVLAAEWFGRHQKQREARPSRIAVTGAPDDARPLLDRLAAGNFVVEKREGALPEAPAAADLGEMDALVAVPADFAGRMARGEAVVLPLYYDQSDDESKLARDRVAKIVEEMAAAELARRLEQRGIPGAYVDPLALGDVNVATKAKVGRTELGKGLPLVIVVMVFMGAFYPAIDQTAGEKERGTLEALLSTPVSRHAIVLGKYLAVASIAFLTGILNVLCLGASILWIIRQASRGSGTDLSLGAVLGAVPWDAVALGVFALACVAALGAGLMMVVASLARSFKEAQTYLAPVQLVTTVPAMAAILPGTSLDYVTAWVPIANVTLLLKDAITGTLSAGPALAALASTALLAFLTLGLTTRLYDSERILFAGEGPRRPRSWRDLLTIVRRPRDAGLSSAVYADPQLAQSGESPIGAGEAMGLYAVVAVIWFFFSPELQRLGTVGMILSFPLLLVTPLLFHARARSVGVAAALGLHRPSPRALVGALLIGSSAWLVGMMIGTLQQSIAPAPAELEQAIEQQIRAVAPSTVTMVLVFALLPAVTEELLCRGMLARALRGALGPAAAIGISAALFAVLHLSGYRFFPQFILGLSLGWVTLASGSVIPAVIIHFLHNGVLLVLGTTGYTVEENVGIPIFIAIWIAGHFIALRKSST